MEIRAQWTRSGRSGEGKERRARGEVEGSFEGSNQVLGSSPSVTSVDDAVSSSSCHRRDPSAQPSETRSDAVAGGTSWREGGRLGVRILLRSRRAAAPPSSHPVAPSPSTDKAATSHLGLGRIARIRVRVRLRIGCSPPRAPSASIDVAATSHLGFGFGIGFGLGLGLVAPSASTG